MMRTLPLSLLFIASLAPASAADAPRQQRGGGSRQVVQTTEASVVPADPYTMILARPADTSVVVSLLCRERTEGLIRYGTDPMRLDSATPRRSFPTGEPVAIPLEGLRPDSRYYYQFSIVSGGAGGAADSAVHTFHTARTPGRAFVFTLTADSHLDANTDPGTYRRTLALARSSAPDFHIDLGDTFMTGKHADRAAATRQYLAQRHYFGSLCASAPLFLVLGNHDGETPRGRGREPESLAVWSSRMRRSLFPNPVPDAFYSGNATPHPEAGLLEDYYAWHWGDALFVVLDPYWHSSAARGREDGWSMSLGDAQYRWLRDTLTSSRAAYKLVFIHHLVGGGDVHARGGAEASTRYEWGGRGTEGQDEFSQRRPGWPEPIHALLARERVRIVFHGHDHFYAHQERDGVVYQLVPQPGYPGNGRAPRNAADYGYVSGTILGSPGLLRVSVGSGVLAVELLRPGTEAVAGSDRAAAAQAGVVAHRYTLPR